MKSWLEGDSPSYNMIRPIRDGVLLLLILSVCISILGFAYYMMEVETDDRSLEELHPVFSVLDCERQADYLLNNENAHGHNAIIYDRKCL